MKINIGMININININNPSFDRLKNEHYGQQYLESTNPIYTESLFETYKDSILNRYKKMIPIFLKSAEL